jgi:hypothetical protein
MPSFQYDSNYARERAFEKVRFGAKSPILEVELNEMQDILRNLIREYMQAQFVSGVEAPLTLAGTSYANTFRINAFWAWVGGRRVYVSGTDNGANLSVTDGHNYFDAGDPPASGDRTDLVFLEVWEGQVKPGEGLYKWGTQNSDQTLINNLLDSRIGQETTWRHQIMNEIRVAPGVTNILNVTDKTGAAVSDLGNGLYGNQSTGHYLIPLLLVPRSAGVTTIDVSKVRSAYTVARQRDDIAAEHLLAMGAAVGEALRIANGLNLELDKWAKQRIQQGEVTITNPDPNAGYFRSADAYALVNISGYPLLDTPNYTVLLELVSSPNPDGVGRLEVYDKQANGFKIRYSGSAASATVRWTVIDPDLL